MVIIIPVKTVSEANRRECWRAKAARQKALRIAAHWATKAARPEKFDRYKITLCRVAPGLLDTDNLAGALKAVRDGIADALGISDGPTAGNVWRYDQRRKAKGEDRYFVEVVIGHVWAKEMSDREWIRMCMKYGPKCFSSHMGGEHYEGQKQGETDAEFFARMKREEEGNQ